MMKRLMTVLAFVSLTMTTLAQETVPVQKYSVATNSFWSNWFVQVGGDYNAWYSNQEHGLGLTTAIIMVYLRNNAVRLEPL